MEQGRYHKLAFEGYMHGKRSGGRAKKRWLDGIKEDMESLNITIQEATRTRQSNLDKDPKRAAIVCLSSIAKSTRRRSVNLQLQEFT